MAWTVEFTPSAEKDLRRLSNVDRRRILDFTRERLALSDDPRAGGLAMRGSAFGGYIRYRVGDFRIIARIEDRTVTIVIVRIGHRREVYRT